VIVDVGGPANTTGAYSGQGVWVDVSNDFAGNSWTETLMIRNVAHVWATVFSQHGGGLQIGDDENTTLRSNVVVRGSLGGCGNGPCLDIQSGTSINIDDMELGSDVNGPLSSSGVQTDSGYILRVGDPNNTSGVVLNSDNMRVKVQDDSDRDWYVGIAGPVLAWTWNGGKIQKGDGNDTGTGTGYFVRVDDGATIGQLNWRNIAESDTDSGAITQLFDLSAAPTINFLCPNCESERAMEFGATFAAGELDTNECLQNNLLTATSGACTAADTGVTTLYRAFGGGPIWIHDASCSLTNDTSVDDADDFVWTFIEMPGDGSTAPAVITGATYAFNGTNVPSTLARSIAKSSTLTAGLIGMRLTTADDTATAALTVNCRVRASTLVADTL
jgi:hypothetical protein